MKMTNRFSSHGLTCALLYLVLGNAQFAIAQIGEGGRLIAHWPLDGSAVDATGQHNGVLASKEGVSEPQGVTGKVGQAMQFGTQSAIEIPLDLNPVTKPVVTFAFWIKWLSSMPTREYLAIVSTGKGDGPSIFLDRGTLKISTQGSGKLMTAKRPLSPDEWHFVSVTWDHRNGNITLIQDNSQAHYEIGYEVRNEQALYVSPRDPDVALGNIARKRYLWIGAKEGTHLSSGAHGIQLDEMYLFEGAPTPEQLAELSGGLTEGQLGEGVQFPDFAGLGTVEISSVCAFPDVCMDQGDTDFSIDRETTPELTSANSTGDPGMDVSGMDYTAGDDMLTTGGLSASSNVGGTDVSGGTGTDSGNGGNTSGGGGLPRPAGEPSFSNVSGRAGDIVRRIDSTDGFLHGLAWWEENDRPCEIRISFGIRYLDDVTDDVGVCNPQGRPDGRVRLQEPDFDNDPRAVYPAIGRLQVCNNDNANFRLKGIRIWGDQINPDGTTTYLPNSASRELPNCEVWDAAVLCPSGVATGIVVHATEATGNRNQIVGLQLICREISVR